MPESHGLTSNIGRWAIPPVKNPIQDHRTGVGTNRRRHRNPKGELSTPDPSYSAASKRT